MNTEKIDIDFIESALNFYWNDAHTNLQRKNLGDIEQQQYQLQLDKAKKNMELLSELEVPVAGVTEKDIYIAANEYSDKENFRSGKHKSYISVNFVTGAKWALSKLAVSGNKPGKVDLKKVSMNIVSQLFDLSGISVDERQYLNDTADRFVLKVLENLTSTPADTLDKEELLEKWLDIYLDELQNNFPNISESDFLKWFKENGIANAAVKTINKIFEEYLRLCSK